jgi:adenylate cyclase class 2
MPVEIELKAWADRPDAVREALMGFAEYQGEYFKEDVYWRPVSPAGCGPAFPLSGIRIRRESSSPGKSRLLVTFKTKEIQSCLEVNREREFEIHEREPFEELLRLFALAPGPHKTKRGGVWIYRDSEVSPEITAELLEVEGLGVFLELEIIAGDDHEKTVAAARKQLLALLAKAGVPEDRMESRYYTEMLASHEEKR